MCVCVCVCVRPFPCASVVRRWWVELRGRAHACNCVHACAHAFVCVEGGGGGAGGFRGYFANLCIYTVAHLYTSVTEPVCIHQSQSKYSVNQHMHMLVLCKQFIFG